MNSIFWLAIFLAKNDIDRTITITKNIVQSKELFNVRNILKADIKYVIENLLKNNETFKDSEEEPSLQPSSVMPLNLSRGGLVEDNEDADIHALLTDLRQSSLARLHLPFTAAYSPSSSGRKNLKAKMQRHSAAETRPRSSVSTSKRPPALHLQGRPKTKAGTQILFH